MTAISPRARVRDLVALSRPSMWVTMLLPFGFGYFLAEPGLVPGTTRGWWAFLVGMLVIGPLCNLSFLAVNDAFDAAGDGHNPRRMSSPVASGAIAPRDAMWIAGIAAAAALVLACVVGWTFLGCTAALLLLGVLYSVPPARLKTRPGGDIFVNAFSAGAIAILAGWATVAPAGEFPWAIALQGVLVGAAGFIPTAMADYDADRASGYRTIAVALGPARTHLLGLSFWVAANVGALTLAWSDTVFPNAMFPVLAVMCPILVIAYHLLFRDARRYAQIKRAFAIVTLLFVVPVVAFVRTYR